MANPAFPGTTIIAGSENATAVKEIQQRLNELGFGPIDVDGDFGAQTFGAVEHLQMRFVGTNGQPLTVDGKVGPATWAVLFGDSAVTPIITAGTPLLTELLSVASSQVGVMESPLGSNRGPQVDQYIKAAGLNPVGNSYAWCACFVYWCFQTAATTLSIPNPCVKTAGVVDHWNRAGQTSAATRILPVQAQAKPSLIVPGCLFLLRDGSGVTGHMGIIEQVNGIQLTTIEGNTNEGGSSNGIGVFRRTARTIPQVNLGFVLYGK